MTGNARQSLLGIVVGYQFADSCSVFHEALESAGFRFIGGLRARTFLVIRLEVTAEV